MVHQKKIIKKINYFISILILTSACSGLSDAKKVLKNQKVTNTDEFLVKKKEPLILPPDFEKLPIPDSKDDKNTLSQEKEKIKKILKVDEKNIKNDKSASSLEESIIEKIR